MNRIYPERTNPVTFQELMKKAACSSFDTSAILTNPYQSVRDFENSVSIRVLNRDEQPRMVGRSVIDVAIKEYKNFAVENTRDPTTKDTCTMTVSKSCDTNDEREYKFISAEGIVWGLNAETGRRVLAMAMTQGSIGLGTKKQATETSLQNIGFRYHQEETVSVPPGKRVHVSVTTFSVVYQMRYTFEFSVPKYGSFPIRYRKSCCGCCCFSFLKCTRSDSVHYWQVVHGLPNYREDNNFAYFTQDGFLSWIGETCEVNKHEDIAA